MEELELERRIATATATEIEQEIKSEAKPKIKDLPSLEDLFKSEKELITPLPELKGLKKVEKVQSKEDQIFKRKEDEKKSFTKRRIKTVSAVYISCLVFILGFALFNFGTLIGLKKDIMTNANTIQNQTSQVEIYEGLATDPAAPGATLPITLNEPRDYGDDTKELTFFDKLTIFFRSLFG